jgi:hypothetical protein
VEEFNWLRPPPDSDARRRPIRARPYRNLMVPRAHILPYKRSRTMTAGSAVMSLTCYSMSSPTGFEPALPP